MTAEDDFQRALDANPEDHQTRLVFADWLQERDDPRAEGYRALAVRRRVPVIPGRGGVDWSQPGFCACRVVWVYANTPSHEQAAAAALPDDWFVALGDPHGRHGTRFGWYVCGARREAEDAAAIAFNQLPPERRAELLAAAPAARKSRGKT